MCSRERREWRHGKECPAFGFVLTNYIYIHTHVNINTRNGQAPPMMPAHADGATTRFVLPPVDEKDKSRCGFFFSVYVCYMCVCVCICGEGV